MTLHLNMRKQGTLSTYEDISNNFRSDVEDLSLLSGSLKNFKNDLNTNFKPFFLNNTLDVEEKRLINFISLRPTTRSSIVTFNALQKVFRARFEEGRSHSSIDLFANVAY